MKDRHVYWHKAARKWAVVIGHLGKRHHLGVFDDAEEAASVAYEFRERNGIEQDPNAPVVSRVTYQDGHLVWARHGTAHARGDAVGCVDARSGYRCLRCAEGKLYVHRLVWEILKGPISQGMQIDHINGDRDDNRIENLRLVTQQENLRNVRRRDSNTTGTTGISALKDGRFRARIGSDGATINLGEFATKSAAIDARKQAEKRLGYHKNHGSNRHAAHHA